MGNPADENVTLADARWVMYTKLQSYPTADALKFKILRSHYISLGWKSSHLKIDITPNPFDYG